MKTHNITCRAFVSASALIALLAIALPASAGVVITPSPGYTIFSAGPDGAFFGTPVPDNLALASNGSTPFSDGDLQPGGPFHFTSRLNDGIYGNSNSWISDDDTPDVSFAGIALPDLGKDVLFFISSIAWGRDNGGEGTQFSDRNISLYTLQRTLVASPGAGTPDTGDANTGWETIGTIDYVSSDDGILGGAFTGHFRNEWGIALGGSPVQATAVRLVMGAENVALDEIELYGSLVAIPEPSTALLAVLGLLGFCATRRRGHKAPNQVD